MSEQKYMIGTCGFVNLGNTCYMNSGLQLMIHCKAFIAFVLDPKFDEYLVNGHCRQKYMDLEREFKKAIDNEIKESPELFASLSKEELEQQKNKVINEYKENEMKVKFEEYKKTKLQADINSSLSKQLKIIVNQIFNIESSEIVPRSFKQSLENKVKSFQGSRQQDVHEFLSKLIENIEEESTTVSKFEIINTTTEMENYLKLRMENKPFNIELFDTKTVDICESILFIKSKYSKAYNPFIRDITTFTKYTHTCQECNNISYKFDHTPLLTLNLKNSNNSIIAKDIIDCFKIYTEEQTTNFKCNKCKIKTQHYKNTKLLLSPPTLFISLCRYDTDINGRVKKNSDNLDIPEYIDISEFCDKNYTNFNVKYRLRAISNHAGYTNGGHYNSYCRSIMDDNQWQHIDDSCISNMSSFDFNKKNAYVLLYESIPE